MSEPRGGVATATPSVSVDAGNAFAGLSEGRLTTRRSALTRTGRFAAMPLFLLATCVVMYFWLQTAQLDSIERRLLSSESIQLSVVRHIQLVSLSTVIVIVVAVPLGILLTRPFARPTVPFFLALANFGQAVPTLGVLVLLALTWGIGFKGAIVALVLYAVLPVLRNTMVGLRQVDPDVKEAATAMGMGKMRVLFRIELPLAVPVILAGIRTALIINVGTATIAVLTNAGGLGQIVYSGIVQNRMPVIIAGSIMTALFALAVDYIAGVIEELLTPRGI